MSGTRSHATPAASRNMTASEERALLQRVHLHGDREARRELVERMLPFVRSIARGYADRGEQLDDLVQAGSIGLVNAIDRFDLTRGLRLSTFAAPHISGEIKRHFRDRAWTIRTPRDVQELHVEVRREAARFESSQGRAPTIGELCALTGRGEEHVLDAIAAGRAFRAASIDVEREDGSSLAERLGGDDTGFDRVEQRVTLLTALERLGDRKREILLLRYGLGLSQREIADRVGISQMHVSRLLGRSLDELREILG